MKKTLILSCALVLGGLTHSAFAADGAGGFLRAEIGRSDVDLTVAEPGFPTIRESDSDTSAIFGGGYWLNANIAVEGHIGVLYNQKLDDETDFDLVTAGVGVVAKKNFGADGHGFFVGGRAGVARVTAQVREDDFDVVDDESSTRPYYGVNVGYDFSERWGLALNWDRRRADFDGDGVNVDVDVDTVSLGGEFRF